MADKWVNTGNLLDDLQQAMGMVYLSDVRADSCRAQVLAALRSIGISAYPLGQWEEALRYLLACQATFCTEQDVIACLDAAEKKACGR